MSDVKTFHESVKLGDLDAVRSMLAGNPELLDATNQTGQSPFLLANYYGQKQVADYLLSQNPQLDVFTAAVAGLKDRVLDEIDRDPSLVASHSSDGWTPLHLAAFFGRADVAAALLERGADVNVLSTNQMRNTPLHAAVAGRKYELVKLLLNENADVNATQTGGWTALHGASQNGDRDIVEVLLAKGAHRHAQADNNQTPLDLALGKGHHEVASVLSEP